MHGSFSSTVATWQTFYLLAGTASATLAGLVFVAVSLHLDLVAERRVSPVFTLARRTLFSFILVVVIALVFVVPDQGPQRLGWPLLVIGMVDLLQAILDGRAVVGEMTRNVGWQNIAARIIPPVVLPLASSIGLILVATTVLAGRTFSLYWMVPIVVVILSSAAYNAWELMLGLAQHKARMPSKHTLGAADEASEISAGHERKAETDIREAYT